MAELEPGEELYLKALHLQSINKVVEAIPLYIESSNLGFPPADILLSSIYTSAAVGVPKDFEKGKFYLSKIAEKTEEVLEWFKKRTLETENAEDYFALGRAYFIGGFGPPDQEMAFKWLTVASEKGHLFGTSNLAYLLFVGPGEMRDRDKAFELYKRIADRGYAPAQYSLSELYKGGVGTPVDFEMCVKYLRPAAIESGYASAQCSLGGCYKRGRGVEQDLKEAIRYFQLAADQRHAKGLHELGICYFNGEGVEANKELAEKCFQLASDLGNDPALLKSMAEKGYRRGSRATCEKKQDVCMGILLGMRGMTELPQELWMIILSSLLGHVASTCPPPEDEPWT